VRSGDGRHDLYFQPGEVFPFRYPAGAPVPLLKGFELAAARQVSEGHVSVFSSARPEDMQRYDAVVDRVAKGYAVISREEVAWSESAQAFMIYLRWIEMYMEAGQGANTGVGGGSENVPIV
jgi:hypothetical protein